MRESSTMQVAYLGHLKPIQLRQRLRIRGGRSSGMSERQIESRKDRLELVVVVAVVGTLLSTKRDITGNVMSEAD